VEAEAEVTAAVGVVGSVDEGAVNLREVRGPDVTHLALFSQIPRHRWRNLAILFKSLNEKWRRNAKRKRNKKSVSEKKLWVLALMERRTDRTKLNAGAINDLGEAFPSLTMLF